jgi:hypothetical protein
MQGCDLTSQGPELAVVVGEFADMIYLIGRNFPRPEFSLLTPGDSCMGMALVTAGTPAVWFSTPCLHSAECSAHHRRALEQSFQQLLLTPQETLEFFSDMSP